MPINIHQAPMLTNRPLNNRRSPTRHQRLAHSSPPTIRQRQMIQIKHRLRPPRINLPQLTLHPPRSLLTITIIPRTPKEMLPTILHHKIKVPNPIMKSRQHRYRIPPIPIISHLPETILPTQHPRLLHHRKRIKIPSIIPLRQHIKISHLIIMITRHINNRTPLCPHRESPQRSLSHKFTRTKPLLPTKRHITHKIPTQHQSINTLRLPNHFQRPDKRRPKPDTIQISPNHLLLIMNIAQTSKRKQRLVRTPLSKVRHTHHTQHTPKTQPTQQNHIRYKKNRIRTNTPT